MYHIAQENILKVGLECLNCCYINDYHNHFYGIEEAGVIFVQFNVCPQGQVDTTGLTFFIGENHNPINWVLGFATKQNLEALKLSSMWLANGTFKSYPQMINQSLMIHC